MDPDRRAARGERVLHHGSDRNRTMANMFQVLAIGGERMDANFGHQLRVQWEGFVGMAGEHTWESAATLREEVPEMVEAYFEDHPRMDTRILCFDPVRAGTGDDWRPGVITRVVGPNMYVMYDGRRRRGRVRRPGAHRGWQLAAANIVGSPARSGSLDSVGGCLLLVQCTCER